MEYTAWLNLTFGLRTVLGKAVCASLHLCGIYSFITQRDGDHGVVEFYVQCEDGSWFGNMSILEWGLVCGILYKHWCDMIFSLRMVLVCESNPPQCTPSKQTVG